MMPLLAVYFMADLPLLAMNAKTEIEETPHRSRIPDAGNDVNRFTDRSHSRRIRAGNRRIPCRM